MSTLKFYWNGIKDNGGKLQRCWYSMVKHENPVADIGQITIYARDYKSFSPAIRAAFVVVNNSEYETDYVEQDSIRVGLKHPLYATVRAAYDAQQAHHERTHAKRYATA